MFKPLNLKAKSTTKTDRLDLLRSCWISSVEMWWPPTWSWQRSHQCSWSLCFHCCFVLHVEMVQLCSGVILQRLQVIVCVCVFSAVCWPMGAVHGAEMSPRAENSPVFTDFLLKCHQTLSRTFSRCSSSNLSCHFTSSHSLLTCSPAPLSPPVQHIYRLSHLSFSPCSSDFTCFICTSHVSLTSFVRSYTNSSQWKARVSKFGDFEK